MFVCLNLISNLGPFCTGPPKYPDGGGGPGFKKFFLINLVFSRGKFPDVDGCVRQVEEPRLPFCHTCHAKPWPDGLVGCFHAQV